MSCSVNGLTHPEAILRTRLFLGFLIAIPSLSAAQDAHSNSPGMVHGAAAALTEPGQGAFGALSEVVRVLEADPGTDWSKMDLDGLQAHLLAMNLLVTGAVVETTVVPGRLAWGLYPQ